MLWNNGKHCSILCVMISTNWLYVDYFGVLKCNNNASVVT